jgi:hypothetical protein
MNPITDDSPTSDDAYPRDARGRPYDPKRVPALLLASASDAEHRHSDCDLHQPLRVYHRETSTGYEFYSAGDTGDEVIVTDVTVSLRSWR